MKKNKILIIILCITILLTFLLVRRNKIVGTIYGPEMDKIVVNNISYVWLNTPYTGSHKRIYIGKGAWQNGERVLNLYRINGDEEFNYLYARFEWEGQIYIRESLVKK